MPAATETTALVTGATSGIGREIAAQLLDAGLRVLVGARDAERGRRTVAELGDGASAIALDVTDESSIAAAAAQVETLDVLVNNAGICIDEGMPPSETDPDLFRHTYETNVFGVVAVTNAFLPALRRAAHPRIVNVSSGVGSLAWSTGPNPSFPFQTLGGGAAAYRSSKTALNALTAFYGLALADDGFKVNALAPGLRATNLNRRASDLGGDPAEGAAGAVRLALLGDDGPNGAFFSWDGTGVPW
jgi:NAD(P)-dependent dehydrogenase (short-subunit alcohol dehydrogenase family)